MISNYQHQKELMQARFDIKTCETMLANIIKDGTSCSPFESYVIVDKAKEVFCIGEHFEGRVLEAGQIVWHAVSFSEPPGKPLKKSQMKRIILTYIDQKADMEVYREYGLGARREVQILRMTTEAMEQGALLTQEDLAHILGSDVKTIRSDIRRIREEGVIVPTRGQQKDIGPGITHREKAHREKAIRLFLEGKEPLEIGRSIKHSLKSVERYIETFCRVVYCHKHLGEMLPSSILQTAFIVGVSTSLVNRYLDLKREYSTKDEYKGCLGLIESRGKVYFDASDLKKNALQRERRRK